MSILRSIAIGAAWTTAAQWFVQLSQFAVSIVLARLLAPSDYGLVGMALVITGFVALFGNLGLGAALIQKKEIDDEYVSTAFWTTVAAGVVLLGAVYFTAPLAADFYNDTRVATVARVAALGLLFGPMNSIVTSLLERHMRYRVVAMLDISTALLGQTTAVGFAFSGMGVWSLVAGTLVAQATRIPLAFLFERWLPGFAFNVAKLKDLFSFGGYLLAFNFVNYLNRNLDKLIIGRALGASQLGYYDMAYQAMLKPLQNVSDTIGRPLFPALSSLQDHKKEAAETYRKIVAYISLITFPAMFGLSAVAADFVMVVLGSQWEPAISVLQILALAGAIQSVSATVGSVYLSQGRSDLMFKVGIFGTIAIATAFFTGIRWGILGVAVAYAITTLLVWIITQMIANSLIALQGRRYWISLLPAARSGALMAIAVVAVREALIALNVSSLARLLASVTSGMCVYSVLLFFDPDPDVRAFRRRVLAMLRIRRETGGSIS